MKIAEVISMASRRFPAASECAEIILRKRRFCSHGTTLFQFLDRFEGEPWWDPDADQVAVIESADFRRKFARWLRARRTWVMDRFNDECRRSRGLNLVRLIKVRPDWKPDRRPLGVYWAFECAEDPAPHWGFNKKGVEVEIAGTVDPEGVNWRETMLARMDYLNGDDESEVQLVPGALVTVTAFDGLNGPSCGRYAA